MTAVYQMTSYTSIGVGAFLSDLILLRNVLIGLLLISSIVL